EFVESAEAEAGAEIENVHEAEEAPEGSEDNTDWWDQGWQGGWDSWGQEPYSSSYGWWKGRPGGSAASWATWDASATASAQAERFLPDFVIAWLLLQRSGLDTTEKSVIVANLRNNFSTQKVKEALKLTWPDEELRKRDSGKNGAMFAAEEEALLADEEGFEPVETPSWEDPEEGYAYQALEDDAQEALAALDDARRTLKDAREKQAQMRRNRGFYNGRSSGAKAPGSRPPIKCFRCGGNHLRRDCPQATSGNTGDQRVHFVFSAVDDRTTAEPDAKDDDTAATETSLLALDEIVATGKAIIDGGATSSLGSEEALQQVAMLNWKATGRDSIEIVPEERPSFRFGNNAQHTCLSTALLRLPISCKDSQMRVHIHDIPGQPVLLSVKSLRALGAVIDFSNDQAVFKALDPKAVVSLETTSSGHQLFPLARDVLEGARELIKTNAKQAQLKEFLKAIPWSDLTPKHKSTMPTTGSTKLEMQQKLIKMGETPPASWTKVQLATRIAELTASMDLPMTEREASKMINRAKTKQALMDLLSEHNQTYSSRHTMDQLRAIMLRYLMETKVPASYDNYMGFGKYSQRTYGQTLTNFPSYTEWAVKTAAEEEECHWRLRR
ncbi:unnamed protein product, partial [Symbiodinium sp. CCMP2456]